jgi:alpha-L-arabinofuranosidase
VPLAITEYNLVAFEAGDELGMMAEAVNAFYIADTIGQMAVNGASMANQWNLVNGVSETGSDYGLIDPETATLNPQYFGIALWSRFGTELLAVENGFDAANEVSVYAGRREDGTLTLLALNKTDDPIDAKIRLKGGKTSLAGTADVLTATSLDAPEVSFNGVTGPHTDVNFAPATALSGLSPNGFSYVLPASSIVLLQLS